MGTSNVWLLSKLKENISEGPSEETFYKELIKDLCAEMLAPENLQKIIEALRSSKIKIYEQSDSENYLSVKETCQFLNISRGSLYNQKNNLHFPKPKRIGRRVIYSKSSLIEFLNKVKCFKRGPPGK